MLFYKLIRVIVLLFYIMHNLAFLKSMAQSVISIHFSLESLILFIKISYVGGGDGC